MNRMNISYADRAEQATNPMAKQVFELMEQKKTNLVLANDETNSEKFFKHVELLGNEIAMLKEQSEVPIEELLEMYKRMEQANEKENGNILVLLKQPFQKYQKSTTIPSKK